MSTTWICNLLSPIPFWKRTSDIILFLFCSYFTDEKLKWSIKGLLLASCYSSLFMQFPISICSIMARKAQCTIMLVQHFISFCVNLYRFAWTNKRIKLVLWADQFLEHFCGTLVEQFPMAYWIHSEMFLNVLSVWNLSQIIYAFVHNGFDLNRLGPWCLTDHLPQYQPSWALCQPGRPFC